MQRRKINLCANLWNGRVETGRWTPLCTMSESAQQLLPVRFFYTGCSGNSPAFQRPSCPSGPEPAYSPVHVEGMIMASISWCPLESRFLDWFGWRFVSLPLPPSTALAAPLLPGSHGESGVEDVHLLLGRVSLCGVHVQECTPFHHSRLWILMC